MAAVCRRPHPGHGLTRGALDLQLHRSPSAGPATRTIAHARTGSYERLAKSDLDLARHDESYPENRSRRADIEHSSNCSLSIRFVDRVGLSWLEVAQRGFATVLVGGGYDLRIAVRTVGCWTELGEAELGW